MNDRRHPVGGNMSNIILRNLPWIAPTAAILVVGSAFLSRFDTMFDGAEPAFAEAQVSPVG